MLGQQRGAVRVSLDKRNHARPHIRRQRSLASRRAKTIQSAWSCMLSVELRFRRAACIGVASYFATLNNENCAPRVTTGMRGPKSSASRASNPHLADQCPHLKRLRNPNTATPRRHSHPPSPPARLAPRRRSFGRQREAFRLVRVRRPRRRRAAAIRRTCPPHGSEPVSTRTTTRIGVPSRRQCASPCHKRCVDGGRSYHRPEPGSWHSHGKSIPSSVFRTGDE